MEYWLKLTNLEHFLFIVETSVLVKDREVRRTVYIATVDSNSNNNTSYS